MKNSFILIVGLAFCGLGMARTYCKFDTITKECSYYETNEPDAPTKKELESFYEPVKHYKDINNNNIISYEDSKGNTVYRNGKGDSLTCKANKNGKSCTGDIDKFIFKE